MYSILFLFFCFNYCLVSVWCSKTGKKYGYYIYIYVFFYFFFFFLNLHNVVQFSFFFLILYYFSSLLLLDPSLSLFYSFPILFLPIFSILFPLSLFLSHVRCGNKVLYAPYSSYIRPRLEGQRDLCNLFVRYVSRNRSVE